MQCSVGLGAKSCCCLPSLALECHDPLPPRNDHEFEKEGEEDCQGPDRHADGGVEGESADEPEGPGLEQERSQRLTAEQRLGNTGVFQIRWVLEGQPGPVGIGFPLANPFEMDGDEIVRPYLRLIAGGHRLAGVLRHGGSIGGRQCLDRSAIGGWENNLLLDQLAPDLILGEVVSPVADSGAEDEDQGYDDLQGEDSPADVCGHDALLG
jgi:hypothetical protein